MFSNFKGTGREKLALAAIPPAAAAAPAQAQAVSEAPVADSRATKLNIAGFEIEGVSIAGQETCIIVPRFKLAFDSGRCPQRAIHQQTLLISHGHLDHVGGVPFHVSSRCLLAVAPSKVVVPPVLVDGVIAMMEATKILQGNPSTEFELIPLDVGEDLVLPGGHITRPFKTTHSIPSQGYVVYSQRKKLKAALQGMKPDEIRDLRLSGVDVTDTFEIPEIAFTGDTTADFLNEPGKMLEDVLRARLLIIEMSFIDDDVTVEQARGKGHMHIANFAAHAHRFHNEAILLIHFSSRYKRAAIEEALNTHLPPALRAKCVPFLNGFE
ncbi:MAG: hypothetical protein WDW38_000720 [Sanguina aurantia]